jgi:hypothetical protein
MLLGLLGNKEKAVATTGAFLLTVRFAKQEKTQTLGNTLNERSASEIDFQNHFLNKINNLA